MFTIQSYTLVSGARYVTLVHEPERKTKWLRIVMMRDRALKVDRILAIERQHMESIEYRGKPYPLKRALRLFRKCSKSKGATKEAKQFLKEAS